MTTLFKQGFIYARRFLHFLFLHFTFEASCDVQTDKNQYHAYPETPRSGRFHIDIQYQRQKSCRYGLQYQVHTHHCGIQKSIRISVVVVVVVLASKYMCIEMYKDRTYEIAAYPTTEIPIAQQNNAIICLLSGMKSLYGLES